VSGRSRPNARRSRYRSHDNTVAAFVPTSGGCLWNEPHFSLDASHVVADCRGPDVPKVIVIRADGSAKSLTLEDNQALSEEVERNLSLAAVRTFSVPLTSAPGHSARVKLILPPEAAGPAPSSGTHPLLVQV